MKAGRELDTLIAEKVMRWEPGPCGWEFGVGQDRCLVAYENWSPSRSISDAWMVAQAVTDLPSVDNFTIHLSPSDHRECEVEISYWIHSAEDSHVAGPFYIHGDTAPHAICLAALKAQESPSTEKREEN